MSEYEKSHFSTSSLSSSELEYSVNHSAITKQYKFKAVKKNKKGASKPANLYSTVPTTGPMVKPIPLAVSADAHTMNACLGDAITHIDDIAVEAKLWPIPWINLSTINPITNMVESEASLSKVKPKNGMLIHTTPI